MNEKKRSKFIWPKQKQMMRWYKCFFKMLHCIVVQHKDITCNHRMKTLSFSKIYKHVKTSSFGNSDPSPKVVTLPPKGTLSAKFGIYMRQMTIFRGGII